MFNCGCCNGDAYKGQEIVTATSKSGAPGMSTDKGSANGAMPGARDPESAEAAIVELIIEKSSGRDKIGLDISQVAGVALKIHGVKEGLVQKWNDSHLNQQVQAGYTIVEVNGVRGSAQEMIQAIARNGTLNMKV